MTTTVLVHTKNGQTSAWSRYVFPFAIDAFAQLGDTLYIRAGNSLFLVRESAVVDNEGEGQAAINGIAQWPWLDLGQPGVSKQLRGIDLVGTGTVPSVSIGYDQANTATFTDPQAVITDTLPGGRRRIPVRAPSLSARITWANAPFTLQAVQLDVQPLAGQP